MKKNIKEEEIKKIVSNVITTKAEPDFFTALEEQFDRLPWPSPGIQPMPGFFYFYRRCPEKMKKDKDKFWEWDFGGRVILSERNVARDRNIFRVPKKEKVENREIKLATLHTGEAKNTVAWKWTNDDRNFLIPVELFEKSKLGGITRDIISYVGQLFRDQHYPEDLKVKAYARQIADGIGMAWGSKIQQEIEDCLALARFFTIQNYQIIQEFYKNNTIKTKSNATFGFIDLVLRATMRDGKEIPRNRQWHEIYLSKLYAAALIDIPPAPIPVRALEAAHQAPWALQVPVKNLAYHLASRVPAPEIRLLMPTLREILCLEDRKDGRVDKTRKSIENVLETLHPIMVNNYNYRNNGYDITLSGNLKKS